jgi:hypothetical protein
VAFYVGLGPLTTVHLDLTKGWAALCSFVGVVYVRESVSCCRPLLCVFFLCAHPSAPQKPGLSFLDVPLQIYFEGRRLIGPFFLFGLNRDIRREESPRTANWKVFE